jgi:serine/threonine-protein kinase
VGPDQYAEVKRVFREAIRWAPEDRAEVVAALASDGEVRGEVMSLLAHHREEERPRLEGGEGAGGQRTLAELLRTERAGRDEDGGAGVGWDAARVIRTLDPIARVLAELAERGGSHGAVRAEHVALAEVDGASAAELTVAAPGADTADAGSTLDRASAAAAAPEQISTVLGPIGPWTDVYALALLCVELMLGRRVAEPGATVADLLTRARDEAAQPTPRAVGLAVPDAVEAVLARALAMRPMERYQDAGRFWAALREAVAASPPAPAPAATKPTPASPAPAARLTSPASGSAASPAPQSLALRWLLWITLAAATTVVVTAVIVLQRCG